jgi:hypothetical protein
MNTSEPNFQNRAYEYTTRELPYSPEACFSGADAEMNRQGWERAWADVTMDGVFVVYRRMRTTFS